ncbi:MAG TPA: hypothetical protein VMH48_11555 [Methylomirabilota bacterium]|nr:hypothetical protein [Methylomirabilota bacterium]
MATYNFTLRGWKALVALGLVLAFFGVRFWWRFQTVDENGRAALSEYLLKEYQGRGQRDLMQRVQAYKAGQPVDPLPELKPMDVEFTSLTALGTGRSGYEYRRMVVKVAITVDGGPPPQGNSTRYFYLNHFGDTWSVSGEASFYSYYASLLP